MRKGWTIGWGKAYEEIFTAGFAPEACCIRFFPGLLTGPCVLSYPCRWGNNFTVWHMSPSFPSLTQYCSSCKTTWSNYLSGGSYCISCSSVTFNNLSWTINKQLQFCVLYGSFCYFTCRCICKRNTIMSHFASSSNTNSVIADIIHEDGIVTGARCITIFGLWELLTNFPNGRRWQKWLLLDSLVRTLREGILCLQSVLTPLVLFTKNRSALLYITGEIKHSQPLTVNTWANCSNSSVKWGGAASEY